MEWNEILSLDEKAEIEFKSAKTKIPLSFYETYSAFANTKGGTIFLGIKENEKAPHVLEGVENAKAKRKQLFDALLNKSKVSVCLCKEEDIEIIPSPKGDIIRVHVNEADAKDKPVYLNGDIRESYFRNDSGDHLLLEEQIESFLNDKSEVRFDSKANQISAEIEDLDQESLALFLQEIKDAGKLPSASGLNPEKILMRIGAFAKSREDNEYKLTNGAILFLGKSADIASICPSLWLDFQVQSEFGERFADRITNKDLICEGNIFQFFYRSIGKAFASAPSPFFVDGGKDVGRAKMQKMLREAFANALSNLDLFDTKGLRIQSDARGITFTNAGTMLVPYEIALTGGVSRPRNPTIFAFFQALGISDRGGYGIPFIFDAADELSLLAPRLIERKETNETILRIHYLPRRNRKSEEETKILNLLSAERNYLSILEIANKTGLGRDKTRRAVELLLLEGLLEDNGKTTKGRAYRLSSKES